MTKEEALSLISEYAQVVHEDEREYNYSEPILSELPSRFPEDGSEKKAMRWLGFMQGALFQKGLFTLDELKEHARRKYVKDAKA